MGFVGAIRNICYDGYDFTFPAFCRKLFANHFKHLNGSIFTLNFFPQKTNKILYRELAEFRTETENLTGIFGSFRQNLSE